MSTRLGLEVVVGLCLLELWLVENCWLAFLEGQQARSQDFLKGGYMDV